MDELFLDHGVHRFADQLTATGRDELSGDRVMHATGNGQAAYLRNLPSSGAYEMNPEQFFELTERNEMPLNQIPNTTSFGTSYQARINNVGLIAALVLDVTFTINTTIGTGTLTATPYFPWNILKRVIVAANGQNELISLEGADLRARWLRVFRNAVDNTSAYSTTITTGNNTGTLEYVIPFAHDDTTLIGSLYAQSDETYLSIEVTTANANDMITTTGNAVVNTISLVVTPHLVFYEIPRISVNNQSVVILPDLSELHGLNMIDNPFANTGDVATRLLRSAGQLLCVYVRIDNGAGAVLNPWSDLTEIRWEYAGNQRPRRYNAQNTARILRLKMNGDYNGDVKPQGQHYFLLDFEVDNPARDVVYPKGVIDLTVITQVANGTSLSNAKVHLVGETLYGGA